MSTLTCNSSIHGLSHSPRANMTSDGTNTYVWDAEDRLIQITYPGSGEYSILEYDASGRCVAIREYSSSTLTNTKLFVWNNDGKGFYQPCEMRDASGLVAARYYLFGQINSTTNYFYTRDYLSSIREMTDTSSTIKSQYSYDPFGRAETMQEVIASDFQYSGDYLHQRSALNLTLKRAYSSNLGRWISRDPIDEEGGFNLFEYAFNSPVNWRDIFGTDVCILTGRGQWNLPGGHTAVLVGNDIDGWGYYSKSARGFGGRDSRRFPTFPDAQDDKALRRYRKCHCWKTTPEQDQIMHQQANDTLNNFYFPLFANCTNFAFGVAASGGASVGNPGGARLPGPSSIPIDESADRKGKWPNCCR